VSHEMAVFRITLTEDTDEGVKGLAELENLFRI
jgi:hypothetical protein